MMVVSACAGVVLSLLLAACTGPGSPAVAPVEVADFQPSALVDVLGPDQIRSIDEPEFESIRAADWLKPDSPVVVLELKRSATAFPLAILTRHEIVNAEIDEVPLAITYCPLCNSAVAYRREVDGRTLTFGVSGKLYFSDLVMFDRETTSLWPQIEGVAVRGPLRGERLKPVPVSMVSFAEFTAAFPEGRVLARPGGGTYVFNPYPGYDGGGSPNPAFFRGAIDDRLPAMARVVGVAIGEVGRAYPYADLEKQGAINDRIGSQAVAVLWAGGARSALDAPHIDDGRRVGGSGVFDPVVDGRTLTFAREGGALADEQTGSVWSVLGIAESGPLEGARLKQLHHLDAFWFAWAAFVPFTTVWSSQ